MAPGGSRLTHEQGEVGQSQKSDTWEFGQRARDIFDSSCKQTQFSFYTHYNHTYVQSRIREIGMQSWVSELKKNKIKGKDICTVIHKFFDNFFLFPKCVAHVFYMLLILHNVDRIIFEILFFEILILSIYLIFLIKCNPGGAIFCI